MLITSPASAFGGSMGGEMSQCRGEVRTLDCMLASFAFYVCPDPAVLVTQETDQAGLSDKKGRQEGEHRIRRVRSRLSSDDENVQKSSAQHANSSKEGHSGDGVSARNQPSMDDAAKQNEECGESQQEQREGGSTVDESEMSSREMMEAAARASLRTKFDHVGIDPHSPHAVERTTSPPPPSLSSGCAASAMAISPHGFVRHVSDQAPAVGDADSMPHHIEHSPLPFFSANESGTPIQTLNVNHSIHLLQMHHMAALVGVSPLDFVFGPAANGTTASAPAPTSSDMADLEVRVLVSNFTFVALRVSVHNSYSLSIRPSQGDLQPPTRMSIPSRTTCRLMIPHRIGVIVRIPEYTLSHSQRLV